MKNTQNPQPVSFENFSCRPATIEQTSTKFSLINLSIGNPDLPPPPEALKELALQVKQSNMHRYISNDGDEELLTTASTWLSKTHSIKKLMQNQLLPFHGAKAAIYLISSVILKPGDEVLVPNPGYPMYWQVAATLGAKPVTYNVPYNSNAILDLAEIEKLCTTNTRAIWINTLQMPTGKVCSVDQLKHLIAFCKEKAIWLINDNPYAAIANAQVPDLSHQQNSYKKSISIISLSKTFHIPGWRIAFILGAAEPIQQLRAHKNLLFTGHFSPFEKAIKTCFEHADQWMAMQRREYEKRRLRMCHLADALRCTYPHPQEGMYLWLKLPSYYTDDLQFCHELAQQTGILLSPGSYYGTRGRGYVRIALTANTHIITEAINRITNHFQL